MLVRRAILAGAIAVTAATAGAAGAWRWLVPLPNSRPAGPTVTVAAAGDENEDPPEGDDLATVKTVRPKRDKAFTVTFHQFATVRAYYQVDLRARASGVIKYLPKDKGARVTLGE